MPLIEGIDGMLPDGIDILPIEKLEGIDPEGRDPLDPIIALEGIDIPLGIEKLPREVDPVEVGGSVAAVVVVLVVVGPAVVGAVVVVGSQEAGMLIEEGIEKELIGSIPRCSTTAVPPVPPAGFIARAPPIMAPLQRPSPEMKKVTRPDEDDEVGGRKDVMLMRLASRL